jgi:hypothetical protein
VVRVAPVSVRFDGVMGLDGRSKNLKSVQRYGQAEWEGSGVPQLPVVALVDHGLMGVLLVTQSFRQINDRPVRS